MSWQCKLIELAPDESPFQGKRQIGDMWWHKPHGPEHQSADYKANRAGKDMLWVQLPGGAFCLDHGYQSNNGWVWTGDPPNITVTPSINEVGIYHGFIRSGVITDDCEGRTYP